VGEEEYMATSKKISTIPFNSLDEGVPPHTPSGTPAPTVSRGVYMFILSFSLDTDRFFFLP
jgi:hypothetical protein